MSVPAQAPVSLYAPQPIRIPTPVYFLTNRQGSILDKDTCNDFFLRHKTPVVISQFYRGWSPSVKDTGSLAAHPFRRSNSNSSSSASSINSGSSSSISSGDSEGEVGTHDSAASPILERPRNPSPRHRQSPIELDLTHQPQQGSIQIGNRINALLKSHAVKNALVELQDAIQTLDLCDSGAMQNRDQFVVIYSWMLRTMCEPDMVKAVHDFTHVDIESDPNSIYHSLIWRMFAKIIETGHWLETSAYIAVIEYLMDAKKQALALQTLYAMPRPCWDVRVYRIALSLHLMQNPKQIQQAEYLMGEFGKPYIEVANPLAPTDLPPLRIETPAMNAVTEKDRANLWIFYQSALAGTEWASERDWYEEKMRTEKKKADGDIRTRRNSIFQNWALRRAHYETNQEQARQDEIDLNNAIIYTALCHHQYAYGWKIYLQMKDNVDEFTPRVAVHLCWRAFGDTPMMTHVSRRREWVERAWNVYGRFMCSSRLLPDQPETPGFLQDLLFITSFAPREPEENTRYSRVMDIYKLLQRLNFGNLLRNDQVVGPMLAMYLLESSTHMCHEAFDLWKRKCLLDFQNGERCSNFALYWALIVLCNVSGIVSHFTNVLEDLLPFTGMDLPTSLLAPIQNFHDVHLGCSNCLFTKYLFKPIDGEGSSDIAGAEELDMFGFVEHKLTISAAGAPIAFLDHALYRRTNIKDPLAANLSMAAALGAAKEQVLPVCRVYYTPNKAECLIRHCFEVGSKHK